MNMNTVNLLLLMGTDEILPPSPPVGDFYWVDNLNNKLLTNTADYIVFNPG